MIVTDVITAQATEWYRDALAHSPARVELVTLLPNIEETLRRDAARADSLPERSNDLHQQLTRESAAGHLPGAVLDTTADPDPRATADRVQDAISRGHALFVAPAAIERTPTR